MLQTSLPLAVTWLFLKPPCHEAYMVYKIKVKINIIKITIVLLCRPLLTTTTLSKNAW